MTLLAFITDLHQTCRFQSAERTGVATTSELRRWFQNKAIWVNGAPAAATDPTPDQGTVLCFFPKVSVGRRCGELNFPVHTP